MTFVMFITFFRAEIQKDFICCYQRCGKVSESTEFSALVLLFSVSCHICTVTIMDGKNIKIMWSALYKSSLQTALNAPFLGVFSTLRSVWEHSSLRHMHKPSICQWKQIRRQLR